MSSLSRPSAAPAKLGLGPRRSGVGAQHQPPFTPGLHGSSRRPKHKAPLPKTQNRGPGAHLPPSRPNGLRLRHRHRHLGVLLERAPPPLAQALLPLVRLLVTLRPEAVENAIATELGTTSPGMLRQEKRRARGYQ